MDSKWTRLESIGRASSRHLRQGDVTQPENVSLTLGASGEAMFRGQIEQTVVRSRSGQVIRSGMRVRTSKPFRELWTDPWPSVLNRFLGRRRPTEMLASYPLPDTPGTSVQQPTPSVGRRVRPPRLLA